MRFRAVHRRWSVGVILLVLSLAGFGSRPLVEARQDGAATASPISSSLPWGPCDDVPDAECASIDVPIDPAQPDGDQLSLRLARLPALDPSHSHGSLLLIPGGPGVGITAAGRWAPGSAIFPLRLRGRGALPDRSIVPGCDHVLPQLRGGGRRAR
jgi:hypothetical protein